MQLDLCHVIKGRNKDNILEWIGLGFNSQPWIPIKRMLHEEVFFGLQVVRMFFHAKNGGNKWNWHLNCSNVQLLNGGMSTLIRYKMCNYKQCRQWQQRTNPNSLRHGNRRTMCFKTIACNNVSLTGWNS